VTGAEGATGTGLPAPGTSARPAQGSSDPLDSPLFDSLLDTLGAASLGDLDARVDVASDALDDPLELLSNAVNMLLDDLAYRQAEREEALRQVSAAEAKEEFLASLSHDMQTPLAIILGAIHVLDATNSPEHLESTLPLMRAAAHRLQRFVQQFLDLARLEAHEILMVRSTTVDVPSVVERTIALFVEYESIAVAMPDTLPPVLADPERVEQILANLLSNAFNYASTPSVTASAGEGVVAIEVSDRGPGMNEEELDRAFAKFERINSRRGPSGTGLGLFISRAMAEAQGGSLTASSEPGVGSRFSLRLPIAAEQHR
jgi:signal transduction histidine kinase